MTWTTMWKRPSGMTVSSPGDFARPILSAGLLLGGALLAYQGAASPSNSVTQAFYFMAASVVLSAALAAVVWAFDHESEKRSEFRRLRYAYFAEKGQNQALIAVNRFLSVGATSQDGVFAQVHIPLFRMSPVHLEAYYTSPLVKRELAGELAVRLYAFKHFNKMADVAEPLVVGAIQSDSNAAIQMIKQAESGMNGLMRTVCELLQVDVPEPGNLPVPPAPGTG